MEKLSQKIRSARLFVTVFLLLAVCQLSVGAAIFSFGGQSAVSAAVDYKVTVTPSTFERGTRPTVSYVTDNPSGKDWIGIYRKSSPTPAQPNPALFWLYCNASGSSDFSTCADGKDIINIETGDYLAVMCRNDGYDIITSTEFKVIPSTQAAPTVKPQSVSYGRTATIKGMADGKITLTAPADTDAPFSGYAVYWGDADGILDGYLPIKSLSKSTLSFNLTANTVIPSEATRLMAFCRNGDVLASTYAEFAIPDSYKRDFSAPNYSFVTISDIHITETATHEHNVNFNSALTQLPVLAPDAKHIFIVGDITDSGKQTEFTQLKNILNKHTGAGLPDIYYTIGNHDFFDSTKTAAQSIALFNQQTNSDVPYYSVEIDGAGYIVLGSEQTGNNATLSQTQLNWLNAELIKYADSSKPVFVLLHQPLENTTAGSSTAEGWHGVNDGEKLRAIVDKYPNAMMFGGHTHWELQEPDNMFDGLGSKADKFNTASVAYLWNDAGQHIIGSQGLIVEVFDEFVLVKGYDFKTGNWVSSALFMSDITKKIARQVDALDVSTDEKLQAKLPAINNFLAEINAFSDDAKTRLASTIAKLEGYVSLSTETKVSRVEALITALPDAIVQNKIADIKTANNAYNALVGDDKAAVTPALVEKLERLMQSVTKIDYVSILITELPSAITQSSVDYIKAAETEYNALTAEEAAAVSASAVTKLNGLTASLARAEGVIGLITALPDTVTKSNAAAVNAAKTAYDGLTSAEQALITDTLKAKLDNAIAALGGEEPVNPDSGCGSTAGATLGVFASLICLSLFVLASKRKFTIHK